MSETSENFVPAAEPTPEVLSLDEPETVATIGATPTPIEEAAEQTQAAPEQLDEITSSKPRPRTPNQLVKLDMNVYMDVGEKEFDVRASTLILPANHSELIGKEIELAPNLKMDDTQASAEWAAFMENGFDIIVRDTRFMSTLQDTKAKWVQKIKTPAGEIFSRTPNFNTVEGQNLSGEKGVLHFMQLMGMGSTFKVFLNHSGFWVTLKAPTEDQLLELNADIANDKIAAGRDTYGLTFSSMSSYSVERVINLASECVLNSSLEGLNKIKDIALLHDMPTLVWALACTIWANGHQYTRACGNIKGGCNHVMRAKIDLAKLLWVNENALTAWQLKHMSNHATNAMKLEEVQRYQKESLTTQKQSFKLLKGTPREIEFVLRIPTIQQYLDKSHAWIDKMVQDINLSVGMDSSERNNMINERSRATWMRQYGHWVEAINTPTNPITDADTLEQIISRLSSQDNVREDFIKEVDSFMDRSCLSVIGIPAYTCPVCHEDNEAENHKDGFTNIIPIDMVRTFFILNVQKVMSIRQRAAA